MAPQDAALTAFLSPKSKLVPKSDKSPSLSPGDWAQKIATILKPGPPFYSRVDNADLIQTIADVALMNCSGQAANAKAITAKEKASTSDKSGDDAWTGIGTVCTSDDEDDGLWSSVLFSVDAEGKDVNLGQSVVIPTHALEQHHFFKGNSGALGKLGVGKTYKWDDWSKQEHNKDDDAAIGSAMTTLLFWPQLPIGQFWSWPSWVPLLGQKDEKEDENHPPAPKTPDSKGNKRVWVPSTTKTSLHAHWWGFTLFIPPPVMDHLAKDTQEAEHVASSISKMLTTILSAAAKFPGLPAPLQAVVAVLQAISPVTQYISTYIGWSWDELKTYDKGQGICLSATWILPVALIPRSWDAPTAPADTNGDGLPDGAPKRPEDDGNKKPEDDDEKKPEGDGAPKKPEGDEQKKPEDDGQKKAEDDGQKKAEGEGQKKPADDSQKKPADDSQKKPENDDKKKPTGDGMKPSDKKPQDGAKAPDAQSPPAKTPAIPPANTPGNAQVQKPSPATSKPSDEKNPAQNNGAGKAPATSNAKGGAPEVPDRQTTKPIDNAKLPNAPRDITTPARPVKADSDDKPAPNPDLPPVGAPPKPNATAPENGGSPNNKPTVTGQVPTLDPKLKQEYPRNDPKKDKAAPGATLPTPTTRPPKEVAGVVGGPKDRTNGDPLGRGRGRQ
ncbi:unnamed protein product [Jaminaea pallidilutea]